MTEPVSTILIVDDELSNRRLLEALLRPQGYLTRSAASGAEALAMVDADPPDLILLDVMMPGMDGHAVAERIKADPATSNIPIIMVTARTDREARLTALHAGAEEFLSKPVDRAELWLRVRNLLRLKVVGEARLERLTHYDALTGLPNRTLFHETLEQALPLALARSWTVAVLFIDLDRFKNVNDTLGHTVGDDLLVQFSRRLTTCVRIRDTVGRLGGDEFALILTMEDGPTGAAVVATKIREALLEPFSLSGHEVTVTASIGITTYPDDTLDRDTLIKYADTAMYQAKHAGRDTFRYFTTRMNGEALARLELEIALRRAVKHHEFVLHYQPKVHLDRGDVTGLEALLRWERPGVGLVSPGEFIPVLEDCGLIVEVGRWVIQSVCAQIADWMSTPIGPMQVAVNVSGMQFADGDLEGVVVDALNVNEVPGELLELELTESSLMANTTRTTSTLENLKTRGVQISIDDFGTGYSSLAYLRRFPIDKLKIDISFVRDITTDPDDAAIAVAIIRMAHSLNLEVIAEGVETAAQREYLRRHRCDQMQGYYFSPALPVTALEHLLLSGAGLPAPEDGAPTPPVLPLVDEDPLVLEALELLLLEEGTTNGNL